MVLQVVLLDVNDNSPVFTEHVYNASISETAPNGSVVASDVKATDVDVNRTMTYIIVPGPTPISSFYIDPKTGKVSYCTQHIIIYFNYTAVMSSILLEL